MDDNIILESLEQIKLAKEICIEMGIDWDEIKCDYKPKVMEYGAFGLA